MNFEKIITILSTIGVAVVGWFLSQLSQWYKNIRSENRTRKKVLFCMLEIHHSISRFDFNVDEMLGRLMDKVFAKSPVPIPKGEMEIAKTEFKAKHSHILNQLMQNIYGSRFEVINEKYEEAVASLSSVSPILAFQLAGGALPMKFKRDIFKSIEQQKDAVEANINMHLTKGMKDIMHEKIDVDVLSFFRKKILQLAFQIGIGTGFRTLWLLRVTNPSSEEMKEEMDVLEDELSERIFKLITEAPTITTDLPN